VSAVDHARWEIRPRLERQPRSPAAIFAWAGFCGLTILAGQGEERIVRAGVAVATLVVAVGLVLRWRHRARLVLSGDALSYIGVFTSKVVARRPAAGHAVTVTVEWPGTRRSFQRAARAGSHRMGPG
jgi:hypothetical protein